MHSLPVFLTIHDDGENINIFIKKRNKKKKERGKKNVPAYLQYLVCPLSQSSLSFTHIAPFQIGNTAMTPCRLRYFTGMGKGEGEHHFSEHCLIALTSLVTLKSSSSEEQSTAG